MKLLIRWVITSFSLFVAAWLVPGIRVRARLDRIRGHGDRRRAGERNGQALAQVVVLPSHRPHSGPVRPGDQQARHVATSAIAVNWFHVGFHVDGFWPAFFGALIVSIVSMILTTLVKEEIGA